MSALKHRASTLGLALLTAVAMSQSSRSSSGAPPLFRISGTIVDGDSGTPLSRARVTIAAAGGNNISRSVITAEDGRFAFADLSGGQYRLTAECRGYLTQAFDEHDRYFSLVVLGPGKSPPDLVFRLPREGSIAGVITNDEGETVRNADVMLFQKSATDRTILTRLRNETKTDDRGYYAFSHLQDGTYYVAVSAEPWYARHSGVPGKSGPAPSAPTRAASLDMETAVDRRLDVSYPVTFFPDVTKLDLAKAIQLRRGTREEANVYLHAVPAVHLRVHTSNPESTLGSVITMEQSIFDRSVSLPVGIRQAAPGVIDVTGVPAGHYTLKLDSLEPQHLVSSSQEIDVNQNADLGRIGGQAYARITAVWQDTAPPATAILSLRNAASGEAIQENIAGKNRLQFRQIVAPGLYDVTLLNAPAFFIRNISANGTRLTCQTLQIKGPLPVSLTIALGRGTTQLKGIAFREDEPVTGAMVVLVADDSESLSCGQREQSNTDGSFVFTQVAPGRYMLFAVANGWHMDWANPKAFQHYFVKAQRIEVNQTSDSNILKVEVQ